jgi:hypothetical protein
MMRFADEERPIEKDKRKMLELSSHGVGNSRLLTFEMRIPSGQQRMECISL